MLKESTKKSDLPVKNCSQLKTWITSYTLDNIFCNKQATTRYRPFIQPLIPTETDLFIDLDEVNESESDEELAELILLKGPDSAYSLNEFFNFRIRIVLFIF